MKCLDLFHVLCKHIHIYICIIYIVFSLKRGHTWLYSIIFLIEWDIINNFWEKKPDFNWQTTSSDLLLPIVLTTRYNPVES